MGITRGRVKQYLQRRLEVPEIDVALDRVAGLGFEPALVFDVGAYQGDFAKACLRRWPKASVACFEPLSARAAQLQELAATDSRMQVFPVLFGAAKADAVLLNEAETASSVLSEHTDQDFLVSEHSMETVDHIVAQHFECPPDLLKLDVQGYELEVLKGAEHVLGGIKMILAEVNFLDIHRQVPLVSDVLTWLSERGWVAYDVCGLTRRPLDRALWQADFLFVPLDSSLRSDKRWSR